MSLYKRIMPGDGHSPSKCQKCCTTQANWQIVMFNHIPPCGSVLFCNKCVPRGCTCHKLGYCGVEPKLEEDLEKDEEGSLLPCICYDYNGNGFRK